MILHVLIPSNSAGVFRNLLLRSGLLYFLQFYNSDHGDFQKEVDKYRILPPASDSEDESSTNEEEIETNKNVDNDGSATSYPPLREITGDDLNKTRTLDRSGPQSGLSS